MAIRTSTGMAERGTPVGDREPAAGAMWGHAAGFPGQWPATGPLISFGVAFRVAEVMIFPVVRSSWWTLLAAGSVM